MSQVLKLDLEKFYFLFILDFDLLKNCTFFNVLRFLRRLVLYLMNFFSSASLFSP